jgi:hypothetical protein
MLPERSLASLVGEILTIKALLVDQETNIEIFGEVTGITSDVSNNAATLTLKNDMMTLTVSMTYDLVEDATFTVHNYQGGGKNVDIEVISLDVGSPLFEAGMAHVEMTFAVIDHEDIVENFNAKAQDLTGEAMADILFPPLKSGPIGIDHHTVKVLPGAETVSVLISAYISDPVLLNDIVSEAGRNSGRDSDWSPETAGAALFEAFLGSNDTGSIIDYGIELQTEAHHSMEDPKWKDAPAYYRGGAQ